MEDDCDDDGLALPPRPPGALKLVHGMCCGRHGREKAKHLDARVVYVYVCVCVGVYVNTRRRGQDDARKSSELPILLSLMASPVAGEVAFAPRLVHATCLAGHSPCPALASIAVHRCRRAWPQAHRGHQGAPPL